MKHNKKNIKNSQNKLFSKFLLNIEKGILPEKKYTKTSITIISCLSEDILNLDDNSPKLIVQWNLNAKKNINFKSYFFHKQKKIILSTRLDSNNNISIPLEQINENLAHITIFPYAKPCFTTTKLPTLEKKDNLISIFLPAFGLSKHSILYDGPILCFNEEKLISFVYCGGPLRQTLNADNISAQEDLSESFIDISSKKNSDFIRTSIVHSSLLQTNEKSIYLLNNKHNLDTALSLYLIRQILLREKITIYDKVTNKHYTKWLVFYQQLGFFVKTTDEIPTKITKNILADVITSFPFKVKSKLLEDLNKHSKTFESIKKLIKKDEN